MRKDKPAGGLPVAWFKGVDAKKKKELEDTLRNSTRSLNRLREVLEEKAEEERIKEVLLSSYDNPSWAHKQAHLNGFQAGMKYVVDLLQFVPR